MKFRGKAQAGFVALGMVLSVPAFAQSLTIQGKVLDGSNNPVSGTATQFRVQILSPDSSRCVLFDETHTLNLSGTSGLFSINLNSGGGTPNLPTTYSLEQAISNRAAFAVNSSYCASGSGTVTYTPGDDDNRKVIIQFRDPGTMTTWETIPEMDLNPMAYAMESRKVGGFPASSLLRVVAGGIPGTAPALTAAEVTELQALAAGTSTKYISRSTNNGAQLPVYSGAPTAPGIGSVWFDSTGSGALKYVDSNGATQTVGNGSGSGTITGVTAGTGLSGGGTSGTVTVSLGTSGVSAGSYGSASAVPVLTVDAYGRITAASTTAIAGTLPPGSSGQFLRSNGTAWSSQSITMADLKSTIGGADLFSAPGCTAAQSLYWDSGTDQLKCQSIAIGAGAITSGTIADARLADVGTAGTYKMVTTDAKGRVTSGSNPTTLAGFGITDAVGNGGGIPTVSSGLLAARPAFGTAGRLYVSTDNLTLYRDNGTSWDIIGAAGGGTSITEVSAGTGLSGGGTSGNVTLNLANVGTAGTYAKVTTDAQGRVTAGTTLGASDIPNLDWAKITSGTPTTLTGYGISDAVRNAGNAVSLQAGTFAARPAFGTAGRLYLATDTAVIYYDTGTAWSAVASNAGSGGDITDVVAGTGLSGGGASGSVTLDLANVGTAGTYAKVTTDAQGRVTAGAALAAGDIPNLDWAKITSGTPTTLTGYGITDAVKNNGAATSFQAGLASAKPAFGTAGRFFFSTDTKTLSYDSGTAWVDLTSGTSAVASVAVTAPIVNNGTGVAPNIGISQASGSTSGYLSSTDWTTFNNKLSTALNSALIWVGNGSNVATPVTPGGDVTMTNAGAFTVTKLQGTAVSSTGPSSGHFLTYNGTNWGGKNINLADLKSTSSGTPALFASPGCTAAQALYWDSGTDQIKCQNIGGLNASAITAGTIDSARLPAGASMWQDGGSSRIYYSAGNVGIGTGTPVNKLDVSGVVGANSGGEWSFRSYQDSGTASLRNHFTSLRSRIGGAVTTGDNLGGLAMGGKYDATNYSTGWNGGAEISGFASEPWSSTARGGDLAFLTVTNGNTSVTEKMRITNSGAVGIGTSVPTQDLEVNSALGGVAQTRILASGAGPDLYLQKARGTQAAPAIAQNADALGHVNFRGYDGAAYTRGARISSYVEGTPAASNMPSSMVFYTNSGASDATERMRITPAGNVAIGSTSATAALNFGDTHSNAAGCADEPNGFVWNSSCRNDVLDVYWDGSQKYGLGIHSSTLELYSGGSGSVQIGNRANDGTGNFTANLSVTPTAVTTPNVMTAANLNQAPIFSTKSSATRFQNSASNTWQYTGESITITVPAGPNRKYRVSFRQMGLSTTGNSQMITSLSNSSSVMQNAPLGMGIPHQTIIQNIWATVSSEGYLDLAPGTYTYYVMVYSNGPIIQVANSTADDMAYCAVIAWPM